MSRAMVVDDDAAVLPIAARWLREEGHEVSTAKSFDEGLAAIRSDCPDILVADIRLGGFNGSLPLVFIFITGESLSQSVFNFGQEVIDFIAEKFAMSLSYRSDTGNVGLFEIIKVHPVFQRRVVSPVVFFLYYSFYVRLHH